MDLHNSPLSPLENHPPSPSAENVFVSLVTPKSDSPQKAKSSAKADEKNVLRRKRGAQFCNNNARKHGFYSNRLPKADLRGVDDTFINSLEDEIVMMRVFLRRLAIYAPCTRGSRSMHPVLEGRDLCTLYSRVVAHSAEVQTLEQELELMRAVCLTEHSGVPPMGPISSTLVSRGATLSITRMVRTQHYITP